MVAAMWRSLFLALGLTCLILGGECLVVERAVLARPLPQSSTVDGSSEGAPAISRRDIIPPEWAPWSLLSAGAVVILYSFTIPKRVSD